MDDTHVLVSGSEWLLLDLTTNSFTPVASLADFKPARGIMVDDGPLTLLAEWGTANGELALFDARTMSVTARIGNDGGTVAPGYNFGHQALSTEAGLVLQFSYYGLVNAFDLSLNPLGVFDQGERVDGIVFDPAGAHFYTYLIDSGVVAQFDAATFERTGEIAIDRSAWHNIARSGDQIAFDDGGTLLAITDGADGTLTLAELGTALPDDGAGNDLLQGTALADVLHGFTGDDIYIFDDPGDMAVELPTEGTDTIEARVDTVLPDNIENLRLSGDAVSATGNALANVMEAGDGPAVLYGMDGDDMLAGGNFTDMLDGGAGADTLSGMGGADLLLGRDADDVLLGGSGDDYLSAGAGADMLDGGVGNDRLLGGEGDDVLSGGGGADTLEGGAGADRFVFADNDFGGAQPDRADAILDFSWLEGDLIDLSAVDASRRASGDQAFAWIGDAGFSRNAGELRAEVQGGFTVIEGDIDGDGRADFAIRVDGQHTLTADDFLL